jgi:hypothetical protein
VKITKFGSIVESPGGNLFFKGFSVTYTDDVPVNQAQLGNDLIRAVIKRLENELRESPPVAFNTRFQIMESGQ